MTASTQLEVSESLLNNVHSLLNRTVSLPPDVSVDVIHYKSPQCLSVWLAQAGCVWLWVCMFITVVCKWERKRIKERCIKKKGRTKVREVRKEEKETGVLTVYSVLQSRRREMGDTKTAAAGDWYQSGLALPPDPLGSSSTELTELTEPRWPSSWKRGDGCTAAQCPLAHHWCLNTAEGFVLTGKHSGIPMHRHTHPHIHLFYTWYSASSGHD